MPEEKVKWPGNSYSSKKEEIPIKEPPKLQGKTAIRKKGLAEKFSDIFVVKDIREVCDTIFYDVLVPNLKDTICKIIDNATSMIFYGGESNRNSSLRDRERTFVVDYSAKSRSRCGSGSSSERRRLNLSDLECVRYEYREDAENVLRNLKEDIVEYDRVSVKAYAAYARLNDISLDYPSSDYGWTDLTGAFVDRRRDGYYLVLPRPRLIR